MINDHRQFARWSENDTLEFGLFSVTFTHFNTDKQSIIFNYYTTMIMKMVIISHLHFKTMIFNYI